jgi:DASS family divalent anion:Na+ symporter
MAEAKKDLSRKKMISEAVAIVFGVVVALTPPLDSNLTPASMIVLGSLVWAVTNWVTQAIPEFSAAVLMCLFWAAFKAVPFSMAFNGFASSTWWILVGALGLGIAVSKSGLLKRVSLYTLKFFPPTFKGQVLAMMGAGLVAAPLIPSTTAKCAITAPIAMGIADQLGLEKRSKGRAGIFNAMYFGFSLNATIFISASFLGYTMVGSLPEAIRPQFPWLRFFVCMIPWAIVLHIGMYFFTSFYYKPKGQVDKIPPDHIKNQIKALGPMSKDEKLTTFILLICLILWIGEAYLGVPAVVPTLAGFCILTGLGVVTAQDFAQKMLWPLMFFIGSVMGLGSVLQNVGVGTFLSDAVSPMMAAIGDNAYLLIIGGTILIYVGRLAVTSLSGSITIFTVMLVPFAQAANINPFIAGVIVYCSTMVWYLRYMNANLLSAYAAAGGDESVDFNHTVPYCFAYMAMNLVGLLISVPFWKMLGLIAR